MDSIQLNWVGKPCKTPRSRSAPGNQEEERRSKRERVRESTREVKRKVRRLQSIETAIDRIVRDKSEAGPVKRKGYQANKDAISSQQRQRREETRWCMARKTRLILLCNPGRNGWKQRSQVFTGNMSNLAENVPRCFGGQTVHGHANFSTTGTTQPIPFHHELGVDVRSTCAKTFRRIVHHGDPMGANTSVTQNSTHTAHFPSRRQNLRFWGAGVF